MAVSSRMGHKPTNQGKRQIWGKVRMKEERKTEREGKGVFPHCKPMHCVFSDPGSMLGSATKVSRPYCSKPTSCWKRSSREHDHQLTRSWTCTSGGFLHPPLPLECMFCPPFSQWEQFQGHSLERAMFIETIWMVYKTEHCQGLYINSKDSDGQLRTSTHLAAAQDKPFM